MTTMHCDFCGKRIPDEVIRKRHYSPGHMPKFVCCNRECSTGYRKQHGFYKEMSVAGKPARSSAVTKSNKEHPRRRKSS